MCFSSIFHFNFDKKIVPTDGKRTLLFYIILEQHKWTMEATVQNTSGLSEATYGSTHFADPLESVLSAS